jgi:hypothetical protein
MLMLLETALFGKMQLVGLHGRPKDRIILISSLTAYMMQQKKS